MGSSEMNHGKTYAFAAIAAVIVSLIFRSFWRGYVQTDWGRYYATTHTRRFRRTVTIYVTLYIGSLLGIAGAVLWLTKFSARP